ncbi:MAG: hypothetical protein FWF84_01990 [Kiritimatiellaeota bacterium]|nr:hypothetical protein [Kiritimatiellota bacterium]
MKKSSLMLLAVAMVATTAVPVLAVPRAGEFNTQNYLFSNNSLDGVVAGLEYRMQPRKRSSVEDEDELRISFATMFVGYDFGSFITLYGLFGMGRAEGGSVLREVPYMSDSDQVKFRSDYYTRYKSSGFAFGGGVLLDLIQQDLASTLTTVQSISVKGAARIATFKGGDFGRWTDFTGNITVGLVNDVIGNKSMMPQQVSLFAGPCFARPITKKRWVSREDYYGLMVGAGLQFNPRASLTGSVEMYKERHTVGVSAAYRF